ncbi:MAG TPA: tetratricopeptide repeat protein [Flavobacterium sp.]|nr:tetratricopeptide repeat protein [Flavobacterium sp.]
MNVTEYTYLLNHPNAVNEKQTQSLAALVENFPYFQSVRALYLKGLYNQDSYKYNFALKQAAAHTTDRSVLFDFITSDEFTIIDKNIYELKLAQLLDIEVKDDIIILQNETVEETINEPFEETVEEIQEEEQVELVPEQDVKVFESEEIISEVKSDVFIENINFVPDFSSEIDIVETEHKIAEEKGNKIELEGVETEKPLEEKLEIGKPLSFSANEKHSFQEWLQLTALKPVTREESQKPGESEKKKQLTTTNSSNKKQKKIELIDKFIESNPKIIPSKEDIEPVKTFEIPDTSRLMTETLARVYLEQKKYQKAIQAYEILILKYPEKSVFFADRIRDIKNLQQNNQ